MRRATHSPFCPVTTHFHGYISFYTVTKTKFILRQCFPTSNMRRHHNESRVSNLLEQILILLKQQLLLLHPLDILQTDRWGERGRHADPSGPVSIEKRLLLFDHLIGSFSGFVVFTVPFNVEAKNRQMQTFKNPFQA